MKFAEAEIEYAIMKEIVTNEKFKLSEEVLFQTYEPYCETFVRI